MAEIALTKGRSAIVDDDDVAWLSQWRWRYKEAGNGRQGYAVRTTRYAGSDRQITIYMHRLILGVESPQADHINGNKLDNRRANLRAATKRQNRGNRPPHGGTSKFKGVVRSGDRWIARLQTTPKAVYLGAFVDEESAARAYDEAARRHFGEFAWLNFPDERAAA